MKISNKQESQQIKFNHSSCIEFKDFMILCKKCTAKPFSFLITDTPFSSDKSLRFWKNLLEKIKKLILAIDAKVRDETLLYCIKEKQQKH